MNYNSFTLEYVESINANQSEKMGCSISNGVAFQMGD